MRRGLFLYGFDAPDHCNMVRGMVPKDRLHDWSVEDGWEPLCAFLGKPILNEPFPHANAAAGWEGHETKIAKKYIFGALRNLGLLVGVMLGAGAAIYKYRHWMQLLFFKDGHGSPDALKAPYFGILWRALRTLFSSCVVLD